MRISDWSSDVCSSDLVKTDAARSSMLPSISIGITRECAAPTDVPIAAIATTAPKARFLKPPLWPTLRLNRLFFLFNIALTSPETATSQCLGRSEEHTSELQSLMRISYAVSSLKKQKT